MKHFFYSNCKKSVQAFPLLTWVFPTDRGSDCLRHHHHFLNIPTFLFIEASVQSNGREGPPRRGETFYEISKLCYFQLATDCQQFFFLPHIDESSCRWITKGFPYSWLNIDNWTFAGVPGQPGQPALIVSSDI